MAKNLVIVESPAKAKTIEKFLGKDYTVLSSYGHVRDLPSKGMGIDIEHGFEPTYQINEDKAKVVAQLKKEAKKADIIWLATDEDREGEAIAWHLSVALDLKPQSTRRIAFHEITKTAVTSAIENPREINIGLVDAQQARRVLDRLVGYELSPVLWKKIRPGLSAGRVQSVAVRLIVEREREIEGFESTSSFRITGLFDEGKKTLNAEMATKPDDAQSAKDLLQKLIGASYTVTSVVQKPGKKSPAAPFTTSTLQQEASRKLGFSVKQTMTIAQRLYEAGKITYMRTDSVNLSDQALGQAKQEIISAYGAKYHQVRKYKTKSAGAQEAHEAIRPTDFSAHNVGGERNEQRLYDLIWKRAIASQMSEAQVERTTVKIQPSTVEHPFTAHGEVLQFDGFLKVYLEGTDEEDEEAAGVLPPLKEGQTLDARTITAREVYARPPARYTEASLVRTLEEMGIGRPSTYAPTISTIQDRGYVEKGTLEGREREIQVLTLEKESIKEETNTEMTGSEKGKLVPTDTGRVVTDFLAQHFEQVMDYHFTAKVETQFDDIAEGKEPWKSMIGSFYDHFHPTVERTATISRQETPAVRELGEDPKTGKPVIARIGRFGPMVQIGRVEDEEKPRFAGLLPGQKLETLTLEEALELFHLPRTVGTTPEGEEILAGTGRFGPYIKMGSTYVSIQAEELFTIELEDAHTRVKEKQKAQAEKIIQDFGDIKVQNGRFGPYITDGKKNAKIPKDRDPKTLTQTECAELIATAPERKKRTFARRKR